MEELCVFVTMFQPWYPGPFFPSYLLILGYLIKFHGQICLLKNFSISENSVFLCAFPACYMVQNAFFSLFLVTFVIPAPFFQLSL
uniref:Putative ovule protein n=1 Tax=Solanum chacoense TaxID=4108 RepID=A0A0V0GMW5_SOLCH